MIMNFLEKIFTPKIMDRGIKITIYRNGEEYLSIRSSEITDRDICMIFESFHLYKNYRITQNICNRSIKVYFEIPKKDMI
jgi:ABC-type polar amino acid transport system ATPase subunit